MSGKSIEEILNEITKVVTNTVGDWLVKGKTGSIQFNLFRGGISSVKFEETVKLGKSDRNARNNRP